MLRISTRLFLASTALAAVFVASACDAVIGTLPAPNEGAAGTTPGTGGASATGGNGGANGGASGSGNQGGSAGDGSVGGATGGSDQQGPGGTSNGGAGASGSGGSKGGTSNGGAGSAGTMNAGGAGNGGTNSAGGGNGGSQGGAAGNAGTGGAAGDSSMSGTGGAAGDSSMGGAAGDSSMGGAAGDSSGGATGGGGSGGVDCTNPTMADMDNDGHNSTACGGDDCDDNNGMVHPGLPPNTWFTTPYTNPAGQSSFDYDCSTHEEVEFSGTSTCKTTLNALGSCKAVTPAYDATPPGCGNPGLFDQTCIGGSVDCMVSSTTQQTQGCH